MGTSFHYREQLLYCEDISIEELCRELPVDTVDVNIDGERIQMPVTPVYVYSEEALKENVETYLHSMQKYRINGKLGYAVKANGNLNLLKCLKYHGVEMLITVSGYEILTGLSAGFLPENIIFNGNGKQSWELNLAIRRGIIINVDSVFDAKNIVKMADRWEDTVKVLLRLRPTSEECQIGVHEYINTSTKSKFGFGLNELDEVLQILQRASNINIYGIHCHLGSGITDPNVYKYIGDFIVSIVDNMLDKGIKIDLVDIGGGIGIDYSRAIPGLPSENSSSQSNGLSDSDAMKVDEFMKIIGSVIPKSTALIIEPGRSLVGNAGILLTKVLGSKSDPFKNYLVVDAAMTELIRPSLYNSFHRFYPTKWCTSFDWKRYDVVGPVCESGDFLGKDILLPESNQSNYLAIMDCGAYAAAMGSNYNMRPKPAEILVDGKNWKYIRRKETFEDLEKCIC